MRCSYNATYAEPVDRVWPVGDALDHALAALPGATLARAGDTVSGSVKCTLGSTQVTYRLTARATGRATATDGGTRSTLVSVEGKEARGGGNLAATLTVTAAQAGTGCTIEVSGDIAVTGRGQSADATSWARVLGRLADGFVAAGGSSEATPEAARVDADRAPRPALTVATPAGDWSSSGPAWLTPKLVGPVVGLMVLLVRRRRRRTRGKGDA